MKHLQKTHSKDETISPPKHMIIIRSNNVSYHVKDQLAALTMSAKYKFWTECFNYKVIEAVQKGSKKYRDTCLKLHSAHAY